MKRKTVLAIFLLVQIVIVKTFGLYPEVVEVLYSNGFYPAWSACERVIFGWLPFSLGDIVYIIVMAWAALRIWKSRRGFFKNWKSHVMTVPATLSVLYFLFHFSWGMNYYRVKLAEKMHLPVREPINDSAPTYSNRQLARLTEMMIEKTNALQQEITGDTDAAVAMPYTQEDIFAENVRGYHMLARSYPFLDYEQPSVKKSLFSLPLTYMGFAGYLNPFTGEAQVNDMIPMYNFPTVAAHEMAHQLGYASESEANFIGYLASIHNLKPHFQYSGYVTALRYCLGNWEARDEKMLDFYLSKVNSGVRANLRESERFWNSHETFVETGFKIFYDNFLKFNKQEGLESYNRFVDLLVGYYRI